jgi:transposase-like protein
MGKQEHSHFTEEFKWKVVKEVLEGRLNKEEARRTYGIRSNSAILYWMRKYSGIENYRDGGLTLGETGSMASSKEEQALRKRILELEQELARERQRADLWQTMIDVAESQLSIDIKKSLVPEHRTLQSRAKRSRESERIMSVTWL